jgi:RNA polymerase sigma factor (sigma-70 family)
MVEDLDLRAAIQNLPEKQREALVLRFYVGLSTPEIAQLMGKQPAAVYSLQARAVASLRGALE